jgi:hypothetical protein
MHGLIIAGDVSTEIRTLAASGIKNAAQPEGWRRVALVKMRGLAVEAAGFVEHTHVDELGANVRRGAIVHIKAADIQVMQIG